MPTKARRGEVTSTVCAIALELEEFTVADLSLRDKSLDVSSIGTAVRRLHKKGLLTRREVVKGKGWLYMVYKVRDRNALHKLAQWRVPPSRAVHNAQSGVRETVCRGTIVDRQDLNGVIVSLAAQLVEEMLKVVQRTLSEIKGGK